MLRMLRTSRFIVKQRDNATSNTLLRIMNRDISKHASVWVHDELLLESGIDLMHEDKGGKNPDQPMSADAMEQHFCSRFFMAYSRRCEMEEEQSNAPPPPPPPFSFATPPPPPPPPHPLSPNGNHISFWSSLPPLPMLPPGSGELSPLPDLYGTPPPPPRSFSLTDFAMMSNQTPTPTPNQTPGRDALGTPNHTPSMLFPDVCRCSSGGGLGVRRGSSSLFASPMRINELFD